MAATRSPLRIRPVPVMPSSAARRCSSGSSIPDSPLPRRRVRARLSQERQVPRSAGRVLRAGRPTRSVVSLTYRSFPAVTCAVPAQGVTRSPGDSGREGRRAQWTYGSRGARRISGDGIDRLHRPRARLARVGRLRREPRRRLTDATTPVEYRRVPRYRDDTSAGPVARSAHPAASTPRGRTGQPSGTSRAISRTRTAPRGRSGPRPAGRSARARSARRRRRPRRARRRAAGRPAPAVSGIAAARWRWCSRSSVAAQQQLRARRVSACTSSAARPALNAASACGTRRRAAGRGRLAVDSVASGTSTTGTHLAGDRQPLGATRPAVRRPGQGERRRAGRRRRCRGAPRVAWPAAGRRRGRSSPTSGHSAQAPTHAGDDGGGRRAQPAPVRDAVARATTRRPGGVQPSSAKAARKARTTRCARRWAARRRPRRRPRPSSPDRPTGELDDVVPASARPAQSKPGRGWRWSRARGRGTRLRVGRAHRPSCAAAAARVDRDGHRRRSAGDRPLRVLEAVAGDRADDALTRGSSSPAAATCSRPATQAADAGSTKTASAAGQQPVGGEDLPVGDRVDRGRRTRRGRPAPWSSEAGLPIRIAVAIVLGLLDHLRRDDRRGAGGLEAPHPRRARGGSPSRAAYSR